MKNETQIMMFKDGIIPMMAAIKAHIGLITDTHTARCVFSMASDYATQSARIFNYFKKPKESRTDEADKSAYNVLQTLENKLNYIVDGVREYHKDQSKILSVMDDYMMYMLHKRSEVSYDIIEEFYKTNNVLPTMEQFKTGHVDMYNKMLTNTPKHFKTRRYFESIPGYKMFND